LKAALEALDAIFFRVEPIVLSSLLKDNLLNLLKALSHVIDETNLVDRDRAFHLLSNIAANSEKEAN